MDTEIIEMLKDQNEEYRKLFEEHKTLEQSLAEINKNKYITPEEAVEKKKIQKQKLVKKDRMAEIIRDFKKSKS
jgi:uncharacterized protein YdcH (DUF465 family)